MNVRKEPRDGVEEARSVRRRIDTAVNEEFELCRIPSESSTRHAVTTSCVNWPKAEVI